MAFLLYKCATNSDGSRTFTTFRGTTLVGKRGPITSYVRDHGNGEWHMPETELLQRCGVEPGEYALVIDLKPKTKGNVSLYQITDVWGYSAYGWTPMALRLETLFVDQHKKEPKLFKKEFSDRRAERTPVYEFLYAIGDARGGTWLWGPTGSVNAAVLWPYALDYFLKEIQARRRRERKAQ